MSDLVGQTIAGYPIQKLLNRGTCDEVYQAASSGAPLAIRVLRDGLRQDAALNAAVVKGWEAARAVAHANLAAVFSTGTDPGAGAYSLEELPPGKPLRQMIVGGSKVAWRDCLVLSEQLFAALQALHGAGQCFGCLWSGSVLITQDQDLKLEGAGGLGLVEQRLTDLVAGAATGYLAPELVEGTPVTFESDIYAAGACVYFIMAGQDAYPGEDADAIARNVLERKPPPLSGLRDDVPPEADEFVARLMAKDPTQRYGAVAAVLADIARLKNGEALAPLQGGRPAAPPRALPQAEERAADEAPVEAPQAAGATAAPQTAIGLAGVAKAPPGTRVVFGRLDTHVKSTIPQSDTEKRGDDLYRQGQLPLALATWKDAYLNATPHAALKVKIDLAEKEVKREAYSLTLEEARYRLGSRDYRGAINRARESLLAAENEAQRQDALAIESDAQRLLAEAIRVHKLKMAVVAVVGVGAIVVLLVLLGRNTNVEPDTGGSAEDLIKKEIAESKGAEPKAESRRLSCGAGTVTLPPPWTVSGNEGRVTAPGVPEPAVTFRMMQYPAGTKAVDKRTELRTSNGLGLKDARKLDDWENIGAFIGGVFICSELGFRYMEGGKARFRYYYLVGGPGDTLYEGQFDGREDLFTPDLRAQMRPIMQSWTYAK